MYSPGPSAAEAASWGLTVDEAGGDATQIWPDNAMAVDVFIAMSTQWRVGYVGATGLDYAALPMVMRMAGVLPGDRREVFDQVRVMEDAALSLMRKK
ncbi:MAG: DUF1799 domain-containing protein [Burkholderiales bacterium]|nr:DUF1799 domain-containing protein [Burkholderiales bacterium]